MFWSCHLCRCLWQSRLSVVSFAESSASILMAVCWTDCRIFWKSPTCQQGQRLDCRKIKLYTPVPISCTSMIQRPSGRGAISWKECQTRCSGCYASPCLGSPGFLLKLLLRVWTLAGSSSQMLPISPNTSADRDWLMFSWTHHSAMPIQQVTAMTTCELVPVAGLNLQEKEFGKVP